MVEVSGFLTERAGGHALVLSGRSERIAETRGLNL